MPPAAAFTSTEAKESFINKFRQVVEARLCRVFLFDAYTSRSCLAPVLCTGEDLVRINEGTGGRKGVALTDQKTDGAIRGSVKQQEGSKEKKEKRSSQVPTYPGC